MYRIRIAGNTIIPGPYPYKIVYQPPVGQGLEQEYETSTLSWHLLHIIYASVVKEPMMYNNNILVQRLLNYIFLHNTVDTVQPPHPS